MEGGRTMERWNNITGGYESKMTTASIYWYIAVALRLISFGFGTPQGLQREGQPRDL